MNNIEKDAKWIKTERQRLITLINKISSIVTEQNLLFKHEVEYTISFDNCMLGNCIALRIWNKQMHVVESMDVYTLESILNPLSFGLDKKRIIENIKTAVIEINNMIKIAKKYADLNKKDE